jgi:hypothetical protein
VAFTSGDEQPKALVGAGAAAAMAVGPGELGREPSGEQALNVKTAAALKHQEHANRHPHSLIAKGSEPSILNWDIPKQDVRLPARRAACNPHGTRSCAGFWHRRRPMRDSPKYKSPTG